MSEAMEITTFRLSAGVTMADFIAANADVDAWLARQPGFLMRRISQRPDGQVTDMLLWASVADGEEAAHGILSELAESPVHSAIDQSSVDWSVAECGHRVGPMRESRPVLDHVEIAVHDAGVSLAFYEEALAALGFSRIVSVPPTRTRTGGARHGLGREGYPCLWIHDHDAPGKGTHIALAADRRADVDAFYQAALRAGGTGNGAPGVRRHYHDRYYAAYVLDPDGVNVEVVCQS